MVRPDNQTDLDLDWQFPCGWKDLCFLFGKLISSASIPSLKHTDIHSVDSSWLAWGEWSHCSLSCGNGNRNRGRGCTGCRKVAQIDFHLFVFWAERQGRALSRPICFSTFIFVLQHLHLEGSTVQGAPKKQNIATLFPVPVRFRHLVSLSWLLWSEPAVSVTIFCPQWVGQHGQDGAPAVGPVALVRR